MAEEAIDALSAASAGYRAVAVLSAAYGDETVAVAPAKLPHPLVLAFDADDAGRVGADRLGSLLEARQRPPVLLDLGSGDLNEAMRHSHDWSMRLPRAIDGAMAASVEATGVSVRR